MFLLAKRLGNESICSGLLLENHKMADNDVLDNDKGNFDGKAIVKDGDEADLKDKQNTTIQHDAKSGTKSSIDVASVQPIREDMVC